MLITGKQLVLAFVLFGVSYGASYAVRKHEVTLAQEQAAKALSAPPLVTGPLLEHNQPGFVILWGDFLAKDVLISTPITNISGGSDNHNNKAYYEDACDIVHQWPTYEAAFNRLMNAIPNNDADVQRMTDSLARFNDQKIWYYAVKDDCKK